MNVSSLEMSYRAYEYAFDEFCSAYQLPPQWFRVPDHFAIKCASSAEYEATLTTIRTEFSPHGMYEAEIQQRRLGSAKLAGRVGMGQVSFGWVEIMEPKPDAIIAESFVEHSEFYTPDLFELQRVLDMRGVEGGRFQDNGAHGYVSFPIDDQGREIKFNDKPLTDVIEQEKLENKVRLLIPEIEENVPSARVYQFPKRDQL